MAKGAKRRAPGRQSKTRPLGGISVKGMRDLTKKGTGNYGTVWVGTDTGLKIPLAVKVPHDFVQKALVIDEARKQALVESLYVVKVYPFTIAKRASRSHKAIVMECCDGTLAKFFDKRRKPRKGIPYTDAEVILSQILEGINAAHKEVVHGDLKPANILMKGEIPKIADFGAARHHSGEFSVVRGSSNWMAPEVIDGRSDGTEESDYFSFGAIAYMLLSGRHPFHEGDPSCLRSEEDNILKSSFSVAPLETLSDAPKAVSQAIMRLLRRGDDLERVREVRHKAFEELQRKWSRTTPPPRRAGSGRSLPPVASPRRPRPAKPSPAAAVVRLPSTADERDIARAYETARKEFFYYGEPDAAIRTLSETLESVRWERFKGSGSRSIADCWSLLAFIHNSRVGGTSHADAEEAATHGLEVDSGHLASHHSRAWARLQRRDYAGAIVDAEQALSLADSAERKTKLTEILRSAKALTAKG